MKDPKAMSTRPLPHEPGDRKCLKCNEMFRSKSAANRICKKCSQVNASLKLSEAQIARERGAKQMAAQHIELFFIPASLRVLGLLPIGVQPERR